MTVSVLRELKWTLQAVLHGTVWGFSTAQASWLQVAVVVQGLKPAALESCMW